jgi:hypothetical protein
MFSQKKILVSSQPGEGTEYERPLNHMFESVVLCLHNLFYGWIFYVDIQLLAANAYLLCVYIYKKITLLD